VILTTLSPIRSRLPDSSKCAFCVSYVSLDESRFCNVMEELQSSHWQRHVPLSKRYMKILAKVVATVDRQLLLCAPLALQTHDAADISGREGTRHS
jgi:hypothetical protein